MIIVLYILLAILYGYGLSLSSGLIEFLAGFFIPPYAIFMGLSGIFGTKIISFLFVIFFIIIITVIMSKNNNEEIDNNYRN